MGKDDAQAAASRARTRGVNVAPMFKKPLELFRLPALTEYDQMRRLQLIRLVIFTAMGLTVALSLLMALTAQASWGYLVFTLLLLISSLAALLSLRRRDPQQVAFIWLLGVWAYLSLALWFLGGVRSPFISTVILLIIVAGLTLEPRRFIYITLATFTSLALMVISDQARLLPPTRLANSPFNAWAGLIASLATAAVLLYLYTAAMRDALRRVRRELLERRAAESALQQSQERYRNFIEHSFEGVWLLAFDEPIPLDLPPEEQVRLIQRTGYVAECNEALARMYGYESRQQLLGKRLLELYGDPPDERNFQATLELAQNNYRRNDRETLEHSRDGTQKVFLNNAVGVIQDGCLVGIWGTQRDITARRQAQLELQRELSERQRAERALQQLNAELEQRVQQRTAQLENALRELEAFAYSVSHDLRAPLRAIDGYSRFLLDDYADRLDDEGKLFLNNIRQAAQNMGRLIEDLLNLSRVSRAELRQAPVSLSGLAAQAVETLRQQQPDRQVSVVIQPDLWTLGDANLLRLALYNLLDNAWKFTRQVEHPLIEFGQTDYGGERAFFVRDNGAGFDMRYVAKLFEPFSRLHSAEEYEGAGVGLANVKRIIERHGGRIWAQGVQGYGATFYFTLPPHVTPT